MIGALRVNAEKVPYVGSEGPDQSMHMKCEIVQSDQDLLCRLMVSFTL